MNNVARRAGPAIGASLGYFVALYLTHSTDWIPADNLPETVAFAGGICTYIVQETRDFVRWVIERYGQ